MTTTRDMHNSTCEFRHAVALHDVDIKPLLDLILQFPRQQCSAAQDVPYAAQVVPGRFRSFVEHDENRGCDLEMGYAVFLDDAEEVFEHEFLHDVDGKVEFRRH